MSRLSLLFIGFGIDIRGRIGYIEGMDKTTKRTEAAEHINATIDGDVIRYYDDATRMSYQGPASDLELLWDLLHDEDPDVRRDAYSHWCSYTHHTALTGSLVGRRNTPATLEDLLAAVRTGAIELTDKLPLYSHDDLPDTHGVWSWDATHAIVGTCVDDLQIVPRSEVE